jgi:rhodanese-related sulfurtransferase
MFRTPPDDETLAVLRERVHLIDAPTALDWYRAGEALIIDVREPFEYGQAHIPGATLVPLSSFEPKHVPPPEAGRLVLHCAVGVRCAHAAMALMRAGHPGPLYRVEGGLKAWHAHGGPVERGSWCRVAAPPNPS